MLKTSFIKSLSEAHDPDSLQETVWKDRGRIQSEPRLVTQG